MLRMESVGGACSNRHRPAGIRMFSRCFGRRLQRASAAPCPRYVIPSRRERRQDLHSAASLRVSFTPSLLTCRFGTFICRIHPPVQLVFNNGTPNRKSLTGSGNELFLAANPILQRRQHPGAERLPVGSIFQQFYDCLVTVKVGNDARREGVSEFLFHHLRIGVSDAKGDERSHIAEDGLTDRKWKLVNVLVRKNEAQTVFTGFRQNGGKSIGREILKLVNEEIEVGARVFGAVCPPHCAELKLGGEQGTEQIRFVMAETPFGEVCDEEPFIVHDEGNLHVGLHLAQNVPNNRIQEKLTELVLNRCDGLALKALVIPLILFGPKRPDERVFDLTDHFGGEVWIGKQAVDAQKGCVPAIKECRYGVVEEIFQAWSPGITPNSFEGGHDAGGHKVAAVRGHVRKHVQANRELKIAGIEIYQVIGPPGRNM